MSAATPRRRSPAARRVAGQGQPADRPGGPRRHGARVRRGHGCRVHRARGGDRRAAGASSSAPWRPASRRPAAAAHAGAAPAAHWLHRVLEAGPASLIGVGHGRTLAASSSSLPRLSGPEVRFVSLLGSLTRHAAANPFDVIHRLTEITGAESYFMPAPFFADSSRTSGAAGPAQPARTCSSWRARPSWSSSASARSARTAHLLATGMISDGGARARSSGPGRGRGARPVPRRATAARSTPRSTSARSALKLEDCAAAGRRHRRRPRTRRAPSRPCSRAGVITGLITDEATRPRDRRRRVQAAASNRRQPITATTGRLKHARARNAICCRRSPAAGSTGAS